MDERRFCCGCGLCSSDGIPPLSQSFSRLGIVRTGFGSALGLSVFKDKLFFGNTCSIAVFFNLFVCFRTERPAVERGACHDIFPNGMRLPAASRQRSIPSAMRSSPRSMRSSPKSAERESERGEAGRFMADSENNQDKLAFFHRFRRNPVQIAFFRLIFVPLADALDAPARQCSNKFDIALAFRIFG